MAPRGRPSKYTPERVKRITDALAAGNSRRAAAAYGGLSEDTLGRWVRLFADFAAQVRVAEAGAEVGFVAVISQAARSGDWRAALAWLERRRPDEWGKTDRVDITVAVRQLVREAGLGADVEAEAVAEAEGYLREIRGAGR